MQSPKVIALICIAIFSLTWIFSSIEMTSYAISRRSLSRHHEGGFEEDENRYIGQEHYHPQERIMEDHGRISDLLLELADTLNQKDDEIASYNATISKMKAKIHSLKGAISELEDKHLDQYAVIKLFNQQKDKEIETLEDEIGRLAGLIENV